ncbi:MAG TPA: ester cyclase [Chloroflexota bacterium]|jgi:steroid delta-isomerase-like uncharacterized protein
MQPVDAKTVAQSYFEELINKHNLPFVDQLFDPAISFHDPALFPGGQTTGLDGVRHFFHNFFTAFPDVHFDIDDFFAEGDKVAIRFTWTGTHKAEFLGITVTERHVIVPGIDIFHVANGKITEVRVAFDRLELIEQLGGITHPL